MVRCEFCKKTIITNYTETEYYRGTPLIFCSKTCQHDFYNMSDILPHALAVGVCQELEALLPMGTEVTLRSGVIRVNTTALRMGGKLCFSTMDDKEVVSSVKASDFMAAKCIRNDGNTCLITVEFKDGSPFLEVFGAVDKAVLDSIYS